MKLRKQICAFLFAALLLLATGACGEAADPDYYRIGLKVTSLISEMTDSDAYFSLMAAPDAFRTAREAANTHDYDRPVAVYSISLTDPEAFLEKMLLEDPDAREAWNSLSPALQDQLMRRITLQTLCASVNDRAGTESIALASLVTPVLTDETLTPEKSRSYLYFFEQGVPVLVSFGYHSASGQFLMIPKESRETPEDIAAFLELPFLELLRLEIPD